MASITALLKQAQQMQKKMTDLQDELGQREVEGQAGGGQVSVRINGKREVLKVSIDPALVQDGDVAFLEDMVAAALNDGLTKVDEINKEAMSGLAGGLNIPGMNMPGFPF